MGIHTDTYSIVYRDCNGECWLVCSPLHHPGEVAKKSKNLDPEINRWKTWIWAMAENVHYSGWNKHFRLRAFSIFRGPDFQANQINTSQLSCPSCGWETLSFSAPQVAFLEFPDDHCQATSRACFALACSIRSIARSTSRWSSGQSRSVEFRLAFLGRFQWRERMWIEGMMC